MRRNSGGGLSGPFDRGWRSGFSAPFTLGAAGAAAVSDAYAIGGASPELVAAFTLQSDGTTAGEYYRKASSETTFSGLFTFSRSGTATYFDSNGTLQTAADGVARRNAHYYNSAWVNGGMQLEAAAATNLFTYSQDFTQADWILGRSAFSDDGTTGLGGQSGSFLWTCNATGAGAALYQAGKGTAATKQTLWTIAEAGGWNLLLVNYFNATNGHQSAWFDLTAGAKLTTSGSVLNDSGIIPLGAGKYLCYITVTPTVTDASDLWRLFLPDADGSFNCDSGDSLYIYHMQTEVGFLPSSPIITTGSTVTRAAETLSIAGADTPANTTAYSGFHNVLLTYADEGAAAQQTLFDQRVDANNRITLTLDTDGAKTGTLTLTMVNGGSSASTAASTELTPGIDVAAKVAWRVTGSEIQIALNGTAAAAQATAIGIPDLSSAAAAFGGIMGFRSDDRMWGTDIGEAGMEEVTT